MNFPTLMTILRQILLSASTYFVTVGIIDQSLIEPLVGGAVALVAVIWGIVAKRKDQVKLAELGK